MATPVRSLKGRDLLSVADLSPQEVEGLVARGLALKRGARPLSLEGKSVALLFEKPSLRTRVSFDVAVHQLGGHPFYLGPQEVGLGVREPVSDVARVLGRMVDAIVCRTFAQKTLEDMARYAAVPVINALSDSEHPCQALADILTVQERLGRLRGVVVAFVGDGNNCAASLALACAAVGAHFRIASPPGYELPPAVVQQAQATARHTGGSLTLLRDPDQAVAQAQVVYTDVWTSMGQEKEAEVRRRAFAGYQVNAERMARAAPGALFLHPMPAHYGEEVPPGFLESPWSAAYDQAENRLHIQKAILEAILAD
ncbi:MAG: ornithine carbamoyltransferase [Dehalococcoidia bacterium]|nr:ornithine carbamoyltransferase [Dehalococcoidia bacterium]MDW8120483.1 ornithine carbamoyltransferase [Chloroflexota bacterium]